MGIISLILTVIFDWFYIFINTLINEKIIWITYPVYFIWAVSEIFEESKEISYKHAAVNGTVDIWVSVDWLREIITKGEITVYGILLSLLNFLIGIFILKSAYEGRRIAKYLGKIKVISYFQIFLTPFIYGIVPFDLLQLLSVFIFFPIVYFVTEIFDKYLPEVIKEEREKHNEYYQNYPQYGQNNYWRR